MSQKGRDSTVYIPGGFQFMGLFPSVYSPRFIPFALFPSVYVLSPSSLLPGFHRPPTQPNPTQPPPQPLSRTPSQKKDNKLTAGVVPLLFINPKPPPPLLLPSGAPPPLRAQRPPQGGRAGGAQCACAAAGGLCPFKGHPPHTQRGGSARSGFTCQHHPSSGSSSGALASLPPFSMPSRRTSRTSPLWRAGRGRSPRDATSGGGAGGALAYFRLLSMARRRAGGAAGPR